MKRTPGDMQLLHDHLRAAAEQAQLLGEVEALMSIELTIELLPEPEPEDEHPHAAQPFEALGSL